MGGCDLASAQFVGILNSLRAKRFSGSQVVNVVAQNAAHQCDRSINECERGNWQTPKSG
jgi:hypothetical protein